jgi:tRNA pseudouridine65 synthase
LATLHLLYRDDRLVAFNKPSGLLVHRSLIDRHERRNAVQMAREQIGQWVYPVHRLDKPTSGVLLFALDPDTARRLSESFTRRLVDKRYLAVVRGYTVAAARIDHPLREIRDELVRRTTHSDKAAMDAITDYQRLATVELPYPVGRYATARYSLIEASPLTGRNRQIRRHMKHIFHPIVGDTSHGDGRHNELFRSQFDCRRLLLHATSLTLAHPHTGVQLRIEALPDNTWRRVLGMFFVGQTTKS